MVVLWLGEGGAEEVGEPTQIDIDPCADVGVGECVSFAIDKNGKTYLALHLFLNKNFPFSILSWIVQFVL